MTLNLRGALTAAAAATALLAGSAAQAKDVVIHAGKLFDGTSRTAQPGVHPGA